MSKREQDKKHPDKKPPNNDHYQYTKMYNKKTLTLTFHHYWGAFCQGGFCPRPFLPIKTHLIIKHFTCMALLSLQSIKIPILLINTGSFYYTYAFTFNTSFIILMNDILKGKANG